MLYDRNQKNGQNIGKLYLYTYLMRKNQKNFKQRKVFMHLHFCCVYYMDMYICCQVIQFLNFLMCFNFFFETI